MRPDDPGPYILKRDPFEDPYEDYVRTGDPKPPSFWPAALAALFFALLLYGFFSILPAHAQTAQCGGNTVSVSAMVDHYAPGIDADHKLYAISKGAQGINLGLAKANGVTVPAGTPEAAVVVALVSDDATIVYIFAGDGCSMAHGLVDAETWDQVVDDAGAEMIEITKAPPPPKNAPSRNGA